MADPNPNQINFFAKTNFRNRQVPFGIKVDDRRRHMYVIGKTGMGKTTMLENMVIQDIRNGNGVCFIDPHGDSIGKILNFVPNDRINDVVYFNPADLDHPIAFNILESVDAKFKHLVASGLMGVFTKIWANMWSARMEYILSNTILALLESPGNTMLGIVRMYVDKKYRKKIVDNIKDPMVKSFWIEEFANYAEKYRTEAVAPIQNKVGQFLSSAIIRNIVGQPKSTLDLRDIMDNRKILLLDLSKGKVGEDNSALLGAMIITKLQLAALSRVDIAESERKDFYLYVDEFQNFVTDSFATILSEARKYRLNLTMGHQYIGQLTPENNTKVRDAVFGNVGSMVVFRVGAADAEYLETEFEPTFTPTDIVN
nr:type IV secretion system DNA-binding domain-containing protein [bacterium]